MQNNTARQLIEDIERSGSNVMTTAAGAGTPPAPPRLNFNRFAEYYGAPSDQKWQIEILKRLFELTQMSPDWDSYGAPVPTRDASFFVLEILNNVMRSRTPIPQVVPSSVGGIQLEWHEKDIDLELHVTAPYQCEVWFHDRRSGAPTSTELTNDFSSLSAPISELTLR
ncbi:MAG: hypothetical protein ACHQRJ_04465 [Alphaproteobacteria bacterium]